VHYRTSAVDKGKTLMSVIDNVIREGYSEEDVCIKSIYVKAFPL
jgi:hypothetical protein